MTDTWIALTRPGFEDLLARETTVGRVKAKADSGWATIACELEPDRKPWKTLDPHRFIFARTLFLTFAKVEAKPREGLAKRVAATALAWRRTERLATGFHSMVVETPDDEAGRKTLTRLGPIDEEIAEELDRMGLVAKRKGGLPRLHVFIPDDETVHLGLSDPVTGSPWPMGAPKLELPEEAPSRSARKIEEALQAFMTPHEREGRLMAGMTAVDLGAAPGGWSFMLSRHGLIVDAVDNGDLAKAAFELGLVTHYREDGYRFRPRRPVDWLFCDMVGGALRIARLVGNWLKRGDFKEAIFNLKLGAGDKLRQINEARSLLMGVAKDSGARVTLEIKHLYHDREEVTAHLVVIERDPTKVKIQAKGRAKPVIGPDGREVRTPAKRPGPMKKAEGRSTGRAAKKDAPAPGRESGARKEGPGTGKNPPAKKGPPARKGPAVKKGHPAKKGPAVKKGPPVKKAPAAKKGPPARGGAKKPASRPTSPRPASPRPKPKAPKK